MSEPAPTRTETCAILLTDVVDSTKLSEILGDAAMARVWASHDRVARDLLPVHRGREIDKTDGFLLLFESAADAVGYALAYHRAIAALDPPLKARAGLHVGAVILTQNAAADVALGAKPLEVDGLAKPTAARVMGLAVGGQTLLSRAAKDALGATDLRLVSHGFWRLKGVTDPLELFEAGDHDAPFSPPPDGAKSWRVVWTDGVWLPARDVPHNLPTERDAFLGRERDLHDLDHLLDDGAHLVSVLGTGGTGKTRLVTRYGWTRLGDWPGGVWFCDLSEARDVDGIAGAVARALGVQLGSGDPVAQLGHALAGRSSCLVVLDNFEQVARLAPDTAGRWIDRAREARFVVTTREVLGLPGEATLALAPLTLPDAVALFVERARFAKRDFLLVEAERPAVEALVKLLDALPLAIELAAARVRLMPPAMLLDRMRERFKLLASSGGRHTRQATLRAAIDWSWDLLGPDERSALAQLSVFEGGFTLASAEAVLSLAEAWPMDAVQALVDKSLVRRVSDGRFDLLVSVREYAAERLDGLGQRAQTEARHGATFAACYPLLRDGVPPGTVDEVTGWVRGLLLEVDNLVVGCARAARAERWDHALTLLDAVQVATACGASRGLMAPLIDGLVSAPRVPPLAEARARLKQLQTSNPDPDTAARLRERIRDVSQGQDSWLLDGLRLEQCRAAVRTGRADLVVALAQEGLAEARARGDGRSEVVFLELLGVGHRFANQYEAAHVALTEAVTLARARRLPFIEANALGNLGHNTAFTTGDMQEVRAHFEASVALCRALGASHEEQRVLGNLGYLEAMEGRWPTAATHFARGLSLARASGAREAEGMFLVFQGLTARARGEPGAARATVDEGRAILREQGQPFLAARTAIWSGVLYTDEGCFDLADAEFAAAAETLRAHGASTELAEALAERADTAWRAGDHDAARVWFDEASALADQNHAPPAGVLRRTLARVRERMIGSSIG